MQNVSSAYKQYLNSSLAISPKSKIVVNGVEYLGDVIKTSPKVSHSNTSFIGGFPAKTISFDIYNINNNLDFENKEILVYRGLTINNAIEWVLQGKFTPQAKDITNNISTKVMTISNAQDRTQLFDGAYTSSLVWESNATHTGLEIIQEICTRLGVTLDTTNFAFANYSFKQPNFNENTTNREVISRMAEIGGEVAIIGCNGNLQIKGQYTTSDSISRSRFEKLSKEKIFAPNTIVLGKEGIDDDIIYPATIVGDRIEFRIEDNPYVDLYRSEMISAVASHIIGKSYTPFELDGFVDGFIYELNDVVSVTDKNGDTFNAVLLDISNTSRIKSIAKAETQDKTTTNYNLAGSKQEAINQVKLEVNHISNEIIALSGRVEDLSDFIREVTDTGSVTLTETVVSEGAIDTLTMSGFTQLGLYPNMVYPSDNTYPGSLTTYTIVQTDGGSNTNESYVVLDSPLTGTDELIISNRKVYVKRGGVTTDTGQSIVLKTYENSTNIYIKYFNNLNYYVKYIIENDFTRTFATHAEVSSQIQITNESINSKVTKGDVISEINQSAETVKITADKINLVGTVTANENFKVLTDGSIEAKNGSFTGDIYLTNGGSIVSDKGLLTSIVVDSNIISDMFIGGNIMLPVGYQQLGSNVYGKSALEFEFMIPKGFTIKNAFITLHHVPTIWKYGDTVQATGYCRNLKLYKSSSYSGGKVEINGESYHYNESGVSYSEVTGAFGSSGFTGSSSGYTKQKSIDIKNYITTSISEDSFNIFKIETSIASPGSYTQMQQYTGSAKATLVIQGFTSFE